MRNLVLLLTSTLAAAAFAVAVFYQQKSSNLAAELTSTEMALGIERSNHVFTQVALDASRAARESLEAHIDRVAADAAHWRKKAADLETREGAHEKLNPYERAVLDSLRGD